MARRWGSGGGWRLAPGAELSDLRRRARALDDVRTERREAGEVLDVFRAAREAAASLRRTEAQELEDVESWSLRRLVRTARGRQESTAQSERADVLVAGEEEDRWESAVAAQQAEVERLDAQVLALGDADVRYAAALEQQARRMISAGRPGAAWVRDLATARDRAAAELREVEEALSAARTVLDRLDADRATLDALGDTGTLPLAGSAAVNRLRQSDEALSTLREELRDAGDDLDLDPALHFADTFDADLFTPEQVRRRVRRAGAALAGLRVTVEGHAEALGARREELAEEWSRAREDHEGVLLLDATDGEPDAGPDPRPALAVAVRASDAARDLRRRLEGAEPDERERLEGELSELGDTATALALARADHERWLAGDHAPDDLRRLARERAEMAAERSLLARLATSRRARLAEQVAAGRPPDPEVEALLAEAEDDLRALVHALRGLDARRWRLLADEA